jgi:hypothetical protein
MVIHDDTRLKGGHNPFTISIADIEYMANVALPQYSLSQWG